MENKTCTSCGLEKTVDDFYKRPNRKTQTHSMCKKCFNNYCTDRWVQKKIDASVEAIEVFGTQGIATAMNQFNNQVYQ